MRKDVESANKHQLRRLPGEVRVFEARDQFGRGAKDEIRKSLQQQLDGLLCDVKLELKVGAQVMLIKNVDEKLVNGRIGSIVGFVTEAEYELRQSSQASEGFEDGNEEKAVQDETCYPLVHFPNDDEPSGVEEMLCTMEEWKVEVETGVGTKTQKITASRTQVPLMLAWAMSIHKAQGQTLSYVEVDIKKAFNPGQVYVALSRVTSADNLRIVNYQPGRMRADARVLRFYERLKVDTEAKEGDVVGTVAKRGGIKRQKVLWEKR